MNNDKIKVSFVGDIMWERPLHKVWEQERSYDASDIFSEVTSLLNTSDYVVGNLETVFAGEEQGYTNEMYSFNTPDIFAKAIKDAGIDLVTTANNHCLDRGVFGMERTLDVLDSVGLEHTGTYKNLQERVIYKIIGNKKIAFLTYTYGANIHETGLSLKEEDAQRINLLKPLTGELKEKIEVSFLRRQISMFSKRFLSLEQRMRIKKSFGLKTNVPRIDVYHPEQMDDQYLSRIEQDIKTARDNSDFVVACLHYGGQFNPEPGTFVEYITRFFVDRGVDAIIGTHPHIVQKAEYIENTFVAYSLGNFTISPSSLYLIHDHLPEYSIIVNLYIQDQSYKVTFSILKILEDESGKIKVYPVDVLYRKLNENEKVDLRKDITKIYNMVQCTTEGNIGIKREYDIAMRA